MDDEATALQNVYLLSAVYEYANGQLYIGDFDLPEDEVIIDNNADNNSYLLPGPYVWNSEGDIDSDSPTINIHLQQTQIESQLEE